MIRAYVDLDGTLFDLYGKHNWLERLRAEDDSVFSGDCRLVTEEEMRKIFPSDKYEVVVLSMTPKHASKEYCKRVIARKNEWLDKFFPSITERIYLPYSDDKNMGDEFALLVDDNKAIRNNFKGIALDPALLWG